jgi:DNA-binding NtrC family response regulator
MKTKNTQEVLIVDDDRAYNFALVNYLQEHFGKYVSIKSYQTGEQCVTNLKSNTEVVVLDYFLNSRFSEAMDGISVLDLIKKKNPNAEVLIVSGQDKLDVAVNAMRHGAFNYIVKGESAFPQISKSIRNILHHFSTSTELKRYRNITIATITSVIFIVGFTIAMQIFDPGILRP